MSKKFLSTALNVVAVAVAFIPIPGVSQLASLAIKIAATALLSVAAGALAKPARVSPTTVNRLTATLDPNSGRKLGFGFTAGGTDVRYQGYTGTNQEYVHWILAAASHAAHSIDELWFDSEKAWSASGGVTSKYAGYLTVDVRNPGTSGNGIAIDSAWTSSCTLTGCAYLHLQFKTTGNSSKATSPFSSSIPSRITVRGKWALLPDIRQTGCLATDQTTWDWFSDDSGRNPALQLLFYLLGWKINGKLAVGRGIPAARLDLDSFITAANHCDETVTLAAGGTEPRYRSDALFSETDDPSVVISSLCAAMNAILRDTGGKLAVHVLHNDLATPIAAFTEADIISDDQWQQTPPLDRLFNIVRGRYVDSSDTGLYQLRDYTEAALTSVDGIDRIDTFDLAAVQSASQAERLAKQRLERTQYPGIFSAKFSYRAWQVNLGDVVTLSHVALGWSSKLFRVSASTIGLNGAVDLTLVEENAAIYAWDREETPAVVAAVPTAYNPLNNPLVAGIGDAGTTAAWPSVTDPLGTRPADNATVGAPAGTLVGGTGAATVEDGANRARTGLDSAGNLQTGLDGGGPATVPVATLLNTTSGTQLAANPEFTGGVSTGYAVYNNAGGSKVTMAIVADAAAPNASGSILRVSYDGTGTPNTNPVPDFGGVTQLLDLSASGVSYPGHYAKGTQVIMRIWAKIPVGRSLVGSNNGGLGTGGSIVALTPVAGTGAYALYAFLATLGTAGSFGTFGYLYITGGANSAFSWDIAKFDQIDVISAPRTFGGTGGDLWRSTDGSPVTTGGLFNDQLTAGADTSGTGGRVRVTLASTDGPINQFQLPSAAQNFDQQWTDVSGTGKPENNADVTSTHVASSVSGQKSGATTQFTRSTTAPSSPATGDHWTDVNFTPPREKIWSGSAWVSATPTQGTDIGVDNGATLGASWTVNVTGRPAELTDGRITAGLTSAGDVNRDLTTARRNSSNLLGYTGGATFTGELGADVTATHVAASISGQAATATSSDFSVITGTGKPADGATADLSFATGSYSTATHTFVGNTATKVGGVGTWDGFFASKQSMVGHGSARFLQPSYGMAGLTTTPQGYSGGSLAQYAGLNFAIYNNNLTAWQIWESGSLILNMGTAYNGVTFSANTLWRVDYDGLTTKYYADGVLMRTSTAAANLQVYFGAAIVNAGAAVTQITLDTLTDRNFANIGGTTRPDDNADVTANAQVTLFPAVDQVVNYDYTGAAKTGQLTRSLTNILKRGGAGGTDVSASATWAFTPSGCTVTAGSNGVVTLNTVSALNATILVTATYGGKDYKWSIQIAKVQDNPPSGGSGSSYFGPNGVSGTVNESAYTTPIVIATGTMQSNGSGQARLNATVNYDVAPSKQISVDIKWQKSLAGANSWSDAGVSATGTIADGGSGNFGDQVTGTAVTSSLATGLTASTNYDFRLVAKYSNASGVSSVTVYGDVSGAQS